MSQERYTDRVEIGRANSVTSYLAHDAQLGRDVELRVWMPSPIEDEAGVEAFTRVAMLRARFEHPGIPALLDSGPWPGGGRYYTVQLARGVALATFFNQPARKWPAPPLRILTEACRAVAHAHERGVVHNDLTAEHVIIASDGAVYVDGWESAQAAAPTDAPESTIADPRTDVYALGGLLAIALRRNKPRNASTLHQLIQKASSSNPDNRPKDATALLAGLEGYMALDLPSGPRKRRRPRRIRTAIGIVFAAGLFALAAAALAWWPEARNRLPWAGSVVLEYLRDRTPDRALAHLFENEPEGGRALVTPYAAQMQLADRAIGVRSFARARAALEQAAQSERHWEWGYLVHRANLDSFTFNPGIGMVFTLAFSPDGQWLAVGGNDRRVQLYRWPAGEYAGNFDGHSGRVVHAEFTPDGRTLITASDDNSVKVWDIATREQRETYSDHTTRIWAVEQLPGGVIASSSWDPNIALWDMNTGENLGVLPAPEGVWTIALAPDQQRLYAGAYDGTFLIYDWDKRWPIHVKHDPENFMTSLEVRSDGEELAAAYFDPVIRLLDADGRPRHELRGHEDSIWDVDYVRDNSRIVSAGRDGTARVWGAESLEQLVIIDGHDSEVNSVALDPEENWLLTASDDGTIKGWRARPWLFGSMPHRSIEASEMPVDLMAPVVLAANGRWAAAGMRSGDVLVWVPRGRRVRHRILPAMKEKVTAIALEPNEGLVAAGGEDGALVLWSSRSGDIVQQFNGHDIGITALEFSPDGRSLYVGGHDQHVRYWDLDTGQPGAMGSHSDSITVIAVSPDGDTIASGSLDETIRIWRDRRIEAVLRKHETFVSALAFSPTGRYLASGGADHQIYIWNIRADDEEPLALGAHNSTVKALSFSPDGRRLFSGGHDGTVRVWNMATLRELLVLDDLEGWIEDVVFVPDQRALLAINSNGTRAVWRAFPWEMRDYPGNAGDSFATRLAAYKQRQRIPQRGQAVLPVPFAGEQ